MKIRSPRHIFRHGFTLMEVLVAMGVFLVLMTILLHFFSGAQTLWSGTDGKNELYADARVAMDLMANTLQSQYYEAGNSVFVFGTEQNKTNALFFPVKMPEEYGSGENLYYLSFIWNPEQNGGLFLRTLGSRDNQSTYRNLFRPATESGCSHADKASALRSSLGYNADQSELIIGGITELKITPVIGGTPVTYADSVNDDYIAYAPFAVKISMQMLGKQQFETWKKLGGVMDSGGVKSGEPQPAKDFRLANARQFDRLVYLGFR